MKICYMCYKRCWWWQKLFKYRWWFTTYDGYHVHVNCAIYRHPDAKGWR